MPSLRSTIVPFAVGIALLGLSAGLMLLPRSPAVAAPAENSTATERQPLWPTALPLAEKEDADVPPYSLVMSDDGLALTINGGIRFGLAEDMRNALDGWPEVRTVILNSPGGRLGAAETAAQLIEEKGLNTFVKEDCESACTRVFVAGKERYLLEHATLGFHGSSVTKPVLGDGLIKWIADQVTVRQYMRDGIDREFMEHAVSIAPASMWFPTHDQLFAAHVITAVVGIDGHLTPPPSATPAPIGNGPPRPPVPPMMPL